MSGPEPDAAGPDSAGGGPPPDALGADAAVGQPGRPSIGTGGPAPDASGADAVVGQPPRPPIRAGVAVLVAAAAALVLRPDAPLGVGFALAVLAVLGAGATLAGRHPRGGPALGFTTLAVALAAQAFLRDDGTLVLLETLAAGWAAALALGSATRWPALLRAAATPWRHLVRGLGLATVALEPLLPKRRTGIGPVARGGALAAGLVAVFGGLFVSADGAFAELANRALVPELGDVHPFSRGLFALLALAVAGSFGLALRRPEPAPRAPLALEQRGLERAEWLLPLAALVGLFAAFVGVQLAVLFGGRRHVLVTAGLGYGDYARQGFTQLVAVAALTLVVIAGATRLARVETRRDAWLLRGLLGALCALTAVVLASALHRLGLVESAYGLTRTRIAGQAIVLWLGALFGLVVLAGLSETVARNVPRASVALGLVALLLYSASAPDARIARSSVHRFEATGRLDEALLRGLSADAVPALTELPRRQRRCALAPQRERLAGDDGWAAGNRARARARAALARTRGEGTDDACRRPEFL